MNLEQCRAAYQEEIRKVISANVRMGGPPLDAIMPDLEKIPRQYIEDHLRWLVDTKRWTPYRGHMGPTLEETYNRMIWEANSWLRNNAIEVCKKVCVEAGVPYLVSQQRQSNGLPITPMRDEIRNWRRRW